MAGTEVELVAAVGQTAVVSDSWHDRAAKTTESEVAAKGWPDVRVVSVHTQPGTTSSGTVVVEAVEVGSMVSAFGPGRSRRCYSGTSWVVRCLSFRPETGSDFGEV